MPPGDSGTGEIQTIKVRLRDATMMPTLRHRDTTVIPHPRSPQTLQDSGLAFDLVVQLIVKSLHFSGDMSGAHLARTLGLQYSVIEPVLHHLKQLLPGRDHPAAG